MRLGENRKLKALFSLAAAMALQGCITAPKESVTLSTTMGKDIVELHRAHRQLAITMFDRMKKDVNRFVDDVYAPSQIQSSMTDFQGEITVQVQKAAAADASGQSQKALLSTLSSYLTFLRANIEDYRKQRLKPLEDQESQVLDRIDRSYGAVEQANAAITGYLSSVVDLKQAQQDALAEAGLGKLQDDVSRMSTEISDKVQAALKKEGQAKAGIDRTAADIDQTIKQLKTSGNQ